MDVSSSPGAVPLPLTEASAFLDPDFPVEIREIMRKLRFSKQEVRAWTKTTTALTECFHTTCTKALYVCGLHAI